MRGVTVIVLALFVAVAAASVHFGHHNHHKPPASHHESCHFQSEKGSYDLRLLVRDMNGKDWELRDEKTQSTFFFNPCGGVQNKACPAGSALCEITNKEMAVSYGSAEQMLWNEAQENAVELSYANGEKCDNGVPRKTVVEMTCSKPTAERLTTVITDMTIDDCMVTIKMTSPYACPVEQLCSVYSKEECEASQGLCAWEKTHGAEKCAVTTSSCFRFGKHHLSAAAVIGIALSMSVLACCGLSLCLCVCCARRRRLNKAKKALPTKAKKSKKAAKAQEMEQVPQPQFIYTPLQALPSGYPGNYVEMNAFPQTVQFIPNTSVQN